MRYDADRGPDARAWTEADERERVAAVEAHHAALAGRHPPVPQPRLHAALHAVVENQLAQDEPPEARRALARLVASGLGRHDAVHAIATVAADAANATLAGGRFDRAGYARALDALTADAWRRAQEP
jgi:hypothetical protein